MDPAPGQVCISLPVVAVVVWLVIRARNAESRPERLGYIAAACGVSGFVSALMGPAFWRTEHATILTIAGVLTLLLAVGAVVAAIMTFRARRQNRQGAPLYPVIGLVCGAANLFCGAGVLGMGTGILVPTGGTPWTWRSAEHGFEVTVPSERWTLQPNPNVPAYFGCPRPHMMAIVAEVRPARTDAEFDAAIARGREIQNTHPTSRPETRSGPNRHGHPHWLFIGEASADKGPVVFGVSVTWVGDKTVLMMFEGQYRMLSQTGQAQEAEAFRMAAREFLGSVK
jgi:hypothetical protein